jgi:hypothetical protein
MRWNEEIDHLKCPRERPFNTSSFLVKREHKGRCEVELSIASLDSAAIASVSATIDAN